MKVLLLLVLVGVAYAGDNVLCRLTGSGSISELTLTDFHANKAGWAERKAGILMKPANAGSKQALTLIETEANSLPYHKLISIVDYDTKKIDGFRYVTFDGTDFHTLEASMDLTTYTIDGEKCERNNGVCGVRKMGDLEINHWGSAAQPQAALFWKGSKFVKDNIRSHFRDNHLTAIIGDQNALINNGLCGPSSPHL